ncbi:uncharacterized protein LOC144370938 [Ictidomys tridecemlineatus]
MSLLRPLLSTWTSQQAPPLGTRDVPGAHSRPWPAGHRPDPGARGCSSSNPGEGAAVPGAGPPSQGGARSPAPTVEKTKLRRAGTAGPLQAGSGEVGLRSFQQRRRVGGAHLGQLPRSSSCPHLRPGQRPQGRGWTATTPPVVTQLQGLLHEEGGSGVPGSRGSVPRTAQPRQVGAGPGRARAAPAPSLADPSTLGFSFLSPCEPRPPRGTREASPPDHRPSGPPLPSRYVLIPGQWGSGVRASVQGHGFSANPNPSPLATGSVLTWIQTQGTHVTGPVRPHSVWGLPPRGCCDRWTHPPRGLP